MKALALILLVGCCPVMEAEEYPPLKVSAEPGGPLCSWVAIDEHRIVTARHCLQEDGVGYGLLDGVPAKPVLVSENRDYAELEVRFDAGNSSLPETSRWADGTRRAPRWLEIVCYVDFQGAPNCGRVLSVSQDSFAILGETRLVRHGDSGSAVMSRDGDFLGVMSAQSPSDLVPAGTVGYAARVD